jgi:hypothetical protein
LPRTLISREPVNSTGLAAVLVIRAVSVSVTSGPKAQQGTGFLRWTSDSVWNNNGDPGRLVNADGMSVAETP